MGAALFLDPKALEGEGIGWCSCGFVDITEDEMKAAMRQTTHEPAGHLANQATVATTSAKPPFRLPTGFSKQKGCPARNPRVEYRQAQRLRADQSVSMAEKFPQLKALKVALEFVDREGMTKTTEMKYKANPEHAKSVLVFVCPSPACWGGDFDLTAKLAEVVKARRTRLEGVVHCLGSHKTSSGQVEPCRSLLRYTLNLSYRAKPKQAPPRAGGPAA